jgi:23S rRNA (uracil1939-C5)-methyltransferase
VSQGKREATHEGRVRDVTQAGEAVVETAQGLVLAHGGVPGDLVRVAVEGKRAGVLWGRVLAVVEPSPDRVAAACAHVETCGGCPLMTLDLPAQHALKLQRARRALEGLLTADANIAVEAPGPALGYRRRVRLSFRASNKARLLGYRGAGGHHTIDVATCPVLEAPLQRGLDAARAHLLGSLAGHGEIELAKATDDAVVLSVSCDTPLSTDTYRAAQALAAQPGIAGVALRVQGGAAATFGETAEQVSLGADGKALLAPAAGFAQANATVNARLVEHVVGLSEPEGARVLELYAGHGNLTVALAQRAASVVAYELDAAAAEACRQNLRARGAQHVRVHATDVASALAQSHGASERFDVLVLDPPRGGAPALADIARRARAKRVVYVSCHMTTLGRDLRALSALGYRVDRAHVLDMFPHTAHVEAVVRAQLNP